MHAQYVSERGRESGFGRAHRHVAMRLSRIRGRALRTPLARGAVISRGSAGIRAWQFAVIGGIGVRPAGAAVVLVDVVRRGQLIFLPSAARDVWTGCVELAKRRPARDDIRISVTRITVGFVIATAMAMPIGS